VSFALTAPAKTKPPKRLRLTATPDVAETALQQQVVDYLRVMVLPPAEWTAFPAGHVALAPADAAKLFRQGLKRGWPDLLLLHNGRLYGIELKKRGAPLSKSRYVRSRGGALRWVEGQEDVLPRLMAAGAEVCVCDSLDGVIMALRGWGVPLRRST
jgi:hypothetical protein